MSRRLRSAWPLRATVAAWAILAAGALAGLLAGCDSFGSGESTEAAATAPKASAGRKPSAKEADMVAAVSTGGAPGLVELRFLLPRHPQAGEAVDVEMAMIPAVKLERLLGRFQASDGLKLVAGAETGHLEQLEAGVPLTHKVTIIPGSDGIFYISAVLLADTTRESVARNFTIPVIAGQGMPVTPAEPTSASVAEPERTPGEP